MPCDMKEINVLERFPEKRIELDAYIDSFPAQDDIKRGRANLIASLHKAQSLFGYLPESVQVFVASKFRLQLSAVYGVVSFYSFFTTTPPGKYKVNVCTGTACFVRGADTVLAEFADILGIKEGETSEDMKFSLGGLRCVGACSLSPVVMVNDRIYGNVTPEMVKDIVNDCK